jgi:flagellar basal-body rod modification protein FlgD
VELTMPVQSAASKLGPSLDLDSYLKGLQAKGKDGSASSGPTAPGAAPDGSAAAAGSAPGAASASGAGKAKGGANLDKDSFMHLMVTQLKYQDPLNPSDNQQMAAQMAQFSSLEALQNMKSSFSDLGKSMKESADKQTGATRAMATTSATALLGSQVRLRRQDIHGTGGPSRIAVHASPGSELAVLDADGETVKTLPLDGIDASGAPILGKSGDGAVEWDGTDDQGKPVSPGKFGLAVRDAASGDDSGYAYVDASISGVGSDSDGTTLETPEGTFHLDDLVQVGARGASATQAPVGSSPAPAGVAASTAIALIGHPVRLHDSSATMSKPGSGAEWSFSADPAAVGQVLDPSGKVVRSFPVSGQNPDGSAILSADGSGRFRWDGEGADGSVQPAGTYHLRLVSPDGRTPAGTAWRQENVDGVGFDGSGNPLLMSNGRAWPYQSLYTVS